MLILSRVVCKPTNSAQTKWDNHVKIMNVNCNWSIALCDNCNQSVMPYGQDEVSIRNETGPMRVFHTLLEGYLHWEYTGLVCIVFGNLVSAEQVVHVNKETMYTSNHSWLLPYQWMGLLVHWEWMSVWEEEVLDLLCALTKKEKRTECQLSHSVILAYQLWWNKSRTHLGCRGVVSVPFH